jgi:hypothetical protein
MTTRASAASGCASDFGGVRAYKDGLFANQPPEGGPGLTQHQLIELGRLVGLTDPVFGPCVANGVHLPWSEYVTLPAAERGVSGTPSVFVKRASGQRVAPAAVLCPGDGEVDQSLDRRSVVVGAPAEAGPDRWRVSERERDHAWMCQAARGPGRRGGDRPSGGDDRELVLGGPDVVVGDGWRAAALVV